MPRILVNVSVVLFVGISVIFSPLHASGQTVAVGTCRPRLVSYSTISAAVAAATPNSTVLVCPGTYPEQVTITQGLTLEGVQGGTGGNPVITVPSGGLALNDMSQATQLSAERPEGGLSGPINISNLIVDGSGSGFDCSTGTLVGVSYQSADGTLNNVEVRNQEPGGCGYGIWAYAFNSSNTVNIRNSSIHDFDDIGIYAANVENGIVLNVCSSLVATASTSAQAGINYYFYAIGLPRDNTIVMAGGTGLWLENLDQMTAKGNTIIGANVGILSDVTDNSLIQNSLLENGTGIAVACSLQPTLLHNIISNSPLGIANAASGDTINRNIFYRVTTLTTGCPKETSTSQH